MTIISFVLIVNMARSFASITTNKNGVLRKDPTNEHH